MELIELIEEMTKNGVEVRFWKTSRNSLEIKITDWDYALKNRIPNYAMCVFSETELSVLGESKDKVLIDTMKRLYKGILDKRC